MKIKIAPSMMCADFRVLADVLDELEEGGADLIHFDIMDGHFVPNFTLGPDLIKDLRGETDLPFDAHLMVYEPERYLETFVRAGCNIITVHAEAVTHLQRTIAAIKEYGVKVGVALNPATSASGLEYVLGDLDMVLIMTVDPGFAGGRFIPAMIPKIKRLRAMIEEEGFEIDIQVDGAVSKETGSSMVAAGANVLVGGSSSVFKGDLSVAQAIRHLREACENGQGSET